MHVFKRIYILIIAWLVHICRYLSKFFSSLCILVFLSHRRQRHWGDLMEYFYYLILSHYPIIVLIVHLENLFGKKKTSSIPWSRYNIKHLTKVYLVIVIHKTPCNILVYRHVPYNRLQIPDRNKSLVTS